MKALAAFGCGVVFALGLGIAGMTRPDKVLGFLDVAGAWDPTLGFVMAAAVLVGLAAFPRILARSRSLLGNRFDLPAPGAINARLLTGAALFGVGWGLSGYCPGPALVSLVTLSPPEIVFVACMLLGLHMGERLTAAPRAGIELPPLTRRTTTRQRAETPTVVLLTGPPEVDARME